MRLPAGASFGVLRRMDMTERVGILAAVSGVGQSFGRGLLPRSTADQAIITGVSLTINYAMTALAQSVTESVADAVIGRGARSRRQRVAHRGDRKSVV